jgi:hypothetical protein
MHNLESYPQMKRMSDLFFDKDVASGDNICVLPNQVQVLLFLASNGGYLFCHSVFVVFFPLDLEAFQESIYHLDAKEVSRSKLGPQESNK